MNFFKYNSKHKIIVGLLIMLYAAYSFTGQRKPAIYDEKGNLKQTGNFKNGKNHGKWVWFYENGRKKMEGSFNNGSREGCWVTFEANGDTLNKSYYKNDKLNGFVIRYKINEPIDTAVYVNDLQLP